MGLETAAALGLASSLIGSGVAAYGAVQQGQAQSAAAKAQADQASYNAQVAGFNAQVANDAQAQKTQAIERQGTLRAGAQRAALGASGVTLDSGSGLDVQSASAADTARSADASNYQGSLSEYGYRTQQQNFVDQASIDRSASANYSTAGYVNAGGSLLSGAGQVADKWYRFTGPQNNGYGMGYA